MKRVLYALYGFCVRMWAAAGLAALTALTALTAPVARAAPPASDHQWQPVEKSSVVSGVRVSGRVVPQDGALMIESARVQGRVLGILRREGERVTAGTPLYEISSAECYSLAEERRVATSKGISELVQGVQKRERQLGMRVEGESCKLVADHLGVLTKRNAEAGAAFNIGDAIATILDTRRLTIEIDVPERDQSLVRKGQVVKVQFASDPKSSFDSKVQSTVPAIDPVTRTMKARLVPFRFPSGVNLDALVFGDIDTETADALLTLPTSALVFYHDQQFVVSGGEEHPKPVAVTVVSENEARSSVRPAKTGLLKEGDVVATKGAIFLFRKLAPLTVP